MGRARVIGGDRLDRKLGVFARGVDLTAEMELAAEITREDYIERIQTINGTKRETRYGPKREVIVSSPGEAPNSDTGNLINRTGVAALGRNKVEVYSAAEYADWLEYGTRKMAPRPAMGPAYKATEKKVVAAIAKAIARKMRSIIGGG